MLEYQLVPGKGVHPFYLRMSHQDFLKALVGWKIEVFEIIEFGYSVDIKKFGHLAERSETLTISVFSEDDMFVINCINSDYVVNENGFELCGELYEKSKIGKQLKLAKQIFADDMKLTRSLSADGYDTYDNDDCGVSVFTVNGKIESVSVYDWSDLEGLSENASG